MVYFSNFTCRSLKVCHSSAFQTISRRSVYIKIVIYSDSISYNPNKTTCDEKTVLLFKQKQDLQGTIFCGGRILSRKCSKIRIFVNSISWNCIQFIFISRGAAFLMRQEYLKQGSNNILKQFLYFSTKNFWKKVDINFKRLNKFNLRF